MKSFLSLSLAWLVGAAVAQSGVWLDLTATTNTPGLIGSATDAKMRDYGRRMAAITESNREMRAQHGLWDSRVPFSMPMTLRLSRNFAALPPVRRGPGDITLVFDASGSRAFPASYQTLLQNVFAAAKPTMDIVFGSANSAGPVLVKNYDADIGDRDAVAGGYFMPNNGSGQMEIRFPVYVSPEATAVNFIHCLLLAYVGPNAYGFDAFQEGLVRAAVMKVVRTPGSLPVSLDTALVESVLDNTYDVGSYYDWYNQRALGGPQFIANNLRDLPLPAGGSLGGIYLLRYQMAGSAWQKLIAENPGFIAEFQRRYGLDTSIASNVPALVALGQASLDAVAGAANSKVENFSFAEWLRRQFILETKATLGNKLLIQPFPIDTGLGGTDFGVFNIAVTYFQSQVGNNETLLSGNSYPIFWDQNFDRIFPSAQEDTMPIAGAYGSVTPNIPNISGNAVYRCAVDIPVGDRIARSYLPVGAIATASNPDPNNFYGTVTGLTLTAGQTAFVRVRVGASIVAEPAITNSAFGSKIASVSYTGYARLKLDVIRRVGSTDTVLMSRYVNKGPGPLAVDLRIGGDTTFAAALTKGIQTLGLGIEPFASLGGEQLGLAENQVLLARFNPTRVAHDLYPDGGGMFQGSGHFVRMPAAVAGYSIAGLRAPGTPVAVALSPGWNMVCTPMNETTTFTRVMVVKATDAPKPWSEALGVELGADAFQFQPGANDTASGAPESGTYVVATNFTKGKAVFVSVNAPEGVTLLFYPSTATAKPGNPFVPVGWRMAASIRDGANYTEVQVGKSTTANSGFDPREDMTLPPIFSGTFRGIVEGTRPLYRDVRQRTSTQTYILRFDGLVKNKTYTVQFAMKQGTAVSFILRDRTNFITRTLSAPSSYTFVAKSTSQRLEVVNAG